MNWATYIGLVCSALAVGVAIVGALEARLELELEKERTLDA